MAATPPATTPFPLTTIWTAPAGCPSYIPDTGTTTVQKECLPPNWGKAEDGKYYSPGICQDGFEISCTGHNTANGATIFPGETVAFCIPKGWECAVNAYPVGATTQLWVNWAFSKLETPITSDTSTITEIWGAAVQVRWKSRDLSILETSPSFSEFPQPEPSTEPSSLATGGVLTVGGTSALGTLTLPGDSRPQASFESQTNDPTDSPTATSSSAQAQDASPGLPTAAIAGIVVGVILLVFMVLGVAFFIFRRKRATAARAFELGTHGEGGNSAVDARELDGSGPGNEMYSSPVAVPVTVAYEKGAENDPVEVDSHPIVQKLMAWQSVPIVAPPVELPSDARSLSTTADGTMNENIPGQTPTPYFWTGQDSGRDPPVTMNAQAGPIDIYSQDQSVASEGWLSPGTGVQTTVESSSPDSRASTTTMAMTTEQPQSPPSQVINNELLERQARIQERRNRLLELERLDREEEELQRQIRGSSQH